MGSLIRLPRLPDRTRDCLGKVSTVSSGGGGSTWASREAAKAMIRAGLRLDKREASKKLFDFYMRNIESDTTFTRFIKKIDGKIDHKILAAGINAYVKVKYDKLKVYPEIPSILKKLKKGFLIGIITDAPKLKAWQRLNAIGLDNLFDIVITLDDTKKRKPHILPFRTAIEKLKLKPSEILFVGDDPRKDILGAKKVGMKTVLAEYDLKKSHKKYLKRIKADYILKKPRDILKIVKVIE